MIIPLLKSWNHPSLTDRLKNVLVPFKEGVSVISLSSRHGSNEHFTIQTIVRMFQWATYPITTALDLIWHDAIPTLDKEEIVDPHLVEIVAVLERTLNFAHTGAARVLQRTLMDRTFLSLGLIFDGFPMLSDDFVSHNELMNEKFHVRKEHWPIHQSTNKPLMLSQRVQTLTYGEAHYQVSYTYPLYLRQYADMVISVLGLLCTFYDQTCSESATSRSIPRHQTVRFGLGFSCVQCCHPDIYQRH